MVVAREGVLMSTRCCFSECLVLNVETTEQIKSSYHYLSHYFMVLALSGQRLDVFCARNKVEVKSK